jgi:hypothetical protein
MGGRARPSSRIGYAAAHTVQYWRVTLCEPTICELICEPQGRTTVRLRETDLFPSEKCPSVIFVQSYATYINKLHSNRAYEAAELRLFVAD